MFLVSLEKNVEQIPDSETVRGVRLGVPREGGQLSCLDVRKSRFQNYHDILSEGVKGLKWSEYCHILLEILL